MNTTSYIFIVLIIALLAIMYKYRDANGKWI